MYDVIYSWVLPIRNEALSLPQLLKEIRSAMSGKRFEIIAVDDASTDETGQVLNRFSKKVPQLKLITFASHQGKWAALSAGFKKAKGEIIIASDSDLQDDPGEVKKLLRKLLEGYDVVSGWRKVRNDPLYKVFISNFGNVIVSLITGSVCKDLNSPFKVYRRLALGQIPKQGSFLRFSLLFAKILGFKTAEVPITHRARLYGNSKFGVVKYVRIMYDLILVLLLFSGSGRIKKL